METIKPYPHLYLGNGVYVEFRGHDFTVYTSNGVNTYNTIYFESEMIDLLKEFKDKMMEKKDADT